MKMTQKEELKQLFSVTFWKDALERAGATVAETLVALWVVAGDQFFDAFTVDYKAAVGVAVGAAVLSLLKSVVAGRATSNSTASPVKAVEYLK